MPTTATPRKEPKPLRALWIDDQPHSINNYRRILRQEKCPLELDTAKSLQEASKKLQSGGFSAVIVDCRMDEHDVSVNGAEFLLSLNKSRRDLPTFVHSAYSDEPRYRIYLDESYAVAIHSKTHDFDVPLLKEPFFAEIVRRAENYFSVKDIYPERIEFGNYMRDPGNFAKDIKDHWKKHGHWITVEMKRHGYLWVYWPEVVKGSKDLFEFPGETEIREIGKRHNLIPFAYSQPLLPEDTPAAGPEKNWSKTLYENDYYPTLKVQVNAHELVDDFDTGAVQTLVSDELIEKGMINFSAQSTHLGVPFNYFSTKATVRIKDSMGVEQVREVVVAVVEDWENSPFKGVNPNRRTLFGRDLLRAFPFEVSLDTTKRVTRIRFLPA